MSQLPLDAYYDLSQVGTVAISPDGSRAAFTTTEYDPGEDDAVSSIFVVPTDGSRDPHRLTRVSGAGSPTWSPDGDRLAFLAARDEDTDLRVGREDDAETDEEDDATESKGDEGDNGDDEPKTQIWCFDLSLGGDARQVTAFEEGVREFDWSPDGTEMVVSARDPTDAEREYLDSRRDGGPFETERSQHKLDGVGYTDTVTTYLFVVGEESVLGDAAADADSARRLDDAYGQGAMEGLFGLQPDWGAGGDIAFVSCRADVPDDTMRTDVLTISPDGGEARVVTDGTRSCGGPTWSPSGDRLAFSSGNAENWCIPTEAWVWDGEATESVTADLDRTLARGSSFEWADDETFYTLVGDEAKTRVLRCSAGSAGSDGSLSSSGSDGSDSIDGSTYERTFEAQGDDRAIGGLSLSADGETAGLVFSHPSEGRDVYALDTSDLDAEEEPDSLTRLSETNAELRDEFEMPDVTRIEYENDGWSVSGVVYCPPAFDPEDPEPYPLVTAIHGGPVSYDEPVFSFDHAAFTSRGYVVFRPNYRGGSSYGRAFCESLHGRWGTVEASDIAAGVEELVDRGWADSDRVFGYGFSYGGIAQGFLVTQYPDLFTAAAPEHGLYDLRSAYGTDDSHVWMENEYGFPWENPDAIDAASAITDAGEIRTPLLVTAGSEDWRCPPSQSEQFYVAAKRAGAECRLVIYEGEHHNIGTPDRAIHRLEELTAWYRRHDPTIEDDGATDPHGREESDADE
jgi:dipeptidyl aminopeptidase/acylaminoacyl peptidase